MHFRFIGGERGTMIRGDILLHVVNHATYHRQWIAEISFQVPAPIRRRDMPIYLRTLGLDHMADSDR